MIVPTQQPEVDPKRMSIIGHSEGTIIVARVALDNPTKVKNMVLMSAAAQLSSLRELALAHYCVWKCTSTLIKCFSSQRDFLKEIAFFH